MNNEEFTHINVNHFSKKLCLKPINVNIKPLKITLTQKPLTHENKMLKQLWKKSKYFPIYILK